MRLGCLGLSPPQRGSTGTFLQGCHPGPPFSGAIFWGLTWAHEVCSKPLVGLPHFIHSRVLSLVPGRPQAFRVNSVNLHRKSCRPLPPPSLLLVVFCENSNEQTQSGTGPEDMVRSCVDKREGESRWRTESEFCFFLTFFILIINAVGTSPFNLGMWHPEVQRVFLRPAFAWFTCSGHGSFQAGGALRQTGHVSPRGRFCGRKAKPGGG